MRLSDRGGKSCTTITYNARQQRKSGPVQKNDGAVASPDERRRKCRETENAAGAESAGGVCQNETELLGASELRDRLL
jgi:hypothetical protein